MLAAIFTTYDSFGHFSTTNLVLKFLLFILFIYLVFYQLNENGILFKHLEEAYTVLDYTIPIGQ